jgi:tRNA dimethylallyltransferase
MVPPPVAAARRAGAPVRCVAILGATATGKSALALWLAPALGGEIISMDSRQVYRGFDIGTAKPTAAERALVPHHLIDVLDPTEPSSAGRHAAQAEVAARAVARRGGVPLLVGGTGLYFRALLHGLGPVAIPRAAQERIRAGFAGRATADLYEELSARDPARAAMLSPRDRVRVTRALEIIAFTGRPASEALRRPEPGPDALQHLKLVLTMPRARLRERIEARTRALFAAGWADEVARLLAAGVAPTAPAMESLGYAELAAAITAGENPASRLDRVITATRQYAKRQETFFRSERDAVWIDVSEASAALHARELVTAFLAARPASEGPQ